LLEGQWLAEAGATSMLDVSDGLTADARHLEAAGEVVLDIDPGRVPCGPGVSVQEALASGEEYELLATLPAAALPALEALWPAGHPVPFTVIGTVTAGPRRTVVTPATGHDHFAPR
jgi:thiamine-monophosphate kinase